jgi:hypothetical protein
MRRRIAFLLPGLAFAAALAASASLPVRAIGGGAGINLVRMEGVLGVKHSPQAIMRSTLLLGEKRIPFSIHSVRRISGVPENGVGVLLPIGSSRPTLRLVGEPSFLDPIEAASPGTGMTLIGDLNYANSYIVVMGVDLPPSTRAE